MSRVAATWTAVISVSTTPPAVAEWLERSLEPEAAREVPRASAGIRRAGAGRIEIAIEAADAGAVRAALNTYLGWVGLSLETARVASGVSRGARSSP